MIVGNNLDSTIQTLANHMVTVIILGQPVILRPQRRICAQVARSYHPARSFVEPVLSFAEGLKMTTRPLPWSVHDKHNIQQVLSVTKKRRFF